MTASCATVLPEDSKEKDEDAALWDDEGLGSVLKIQSKEQQGSSGPAPNPASSNTAQETERLTEKQQ